MGAEKLLGMGDMLMLTSDMSKPIRVQASFISDEETEKVTKQIRDQRPPQYDNDIISQPVQLGNGKGSNVMEMGGGNSSADDDMFRETKSAHLSRLRRGRNRP